MLALLGLVILFVIVVVLLCKAAVALGDRLDKRQEEKELRKLEYKFKANEKER